MTHCDLTAVVFRQIVPNLQPEHDTNPPVLSSLYIKKSSPEAAEVAGAGTWTYPCIYSISFSSLWVFRLQISGYNFQALYNQLSSLTLFSRHTLITIHGLNHKNTKRTLDYLPLLPEEPLTFICVTLHEQNMAVLPWDPASWLLIKVFWKCLVY